MLESYILGGHWRIPSGFRHKHFFVAAMEGVSLINPSRNFRGWIPLQS